MERKGQVMELGKEAFQSVTDLVSYHFHQNSARS